MSEFFGWLGNLSLAQWYALILLMELVFGFFDMFVKERGAEFRQLKDAAPEWFPRWAQIVAAVTSIVVVAVLWPLFTVVEFVRLVRGAVVWVADKYLAWYTRRALKKILAEDAAGGYVHGPRGSDDDISVIFHGPVEFPSREMSEELDDARHRRERQQ